MTEEQSNTSNWLEIEAEALNTSFTGEKLPSFKFVEENKPETIKVDFSKEWGKYTQKNDNGKSVVKAMIPLEHNGVRKMWWLNKKNPTFAALIKAGKAGQTIFKVMRVGSQTDTKYVFVKD